MDDLRRSEAHFRSVVRSSVDAVVILDGGLSVRWASDALAEMLGVEPGATVGRPVGAALHPEDSPSVLASLGTRPATEPTEVMTVIGRVRHRDRGWRLIQARVRDLRGDPDVGALVLYCRDVTTPVVGPRMSRHP